MTAPSADELAAAQTTSSQGFPRQSRLLTASDYNTVFRKNRKFSDQYWTLLVHESQGTRARLGLAIAKKKAKRAVDRNRIKRIARETFRYNAARLEGKEIVVMNRDAAVRAENTVLKAALQKLISKVAPVAAA